MKVFKVCGRVLVMLFIILAVIAAIAFLFLEFYPTIGKKPGKTEKENYAARTEFYHNGQFHNENDYRVMTGTQAEKSALTMPGEMIPTEKLESVERAGAGELRVTWLGHSSSLVQLGEQNVLIDPVMGGRSSPVSFAGPKRFSEVALSSENIPEIDVLFISHDHYDHLDYDVIRAVDHKVSHYVVPLGIDVILKGWGVEEAKLHPLTWWESVELNGVIYTLIPAQHYTGRNPLKANATLWGGLYMRDSMHSVYYSGDTGYYDVFARVYERFGETDLMLADAGQYDPAWAETHMFPEETVQAAVDAHAKVLLPVHWGAYSLSNHAWYDPPERAVAAAEAAGLPLATPRIGQTVDYENIGLFSEHWWEQFKEPGSMGEMPAGIAMTPEVMIPAEEMEPETEEMAQEMKLKIGDQEVMVTWENNESVEALRELVKTEPLTIRMSMYGGFEQVGFIGASLPRNDVQTVTQAGDIVLYSGNQIVVFYGSNSWAYTRLGRIEGLQAGEFTDLLGNGEVVITVFNE